ncbi:NAD(P)-dependent oxidoreductase [Pedobacter sp.]|uniref:NAD(P)-dependent oxidoreductase n=1 Tax=Pedobacter sp. TaxID=1411316 RepID=UPI003D7FAB81
MKTALIGASGFVGTSILEELLNRGHQVTAIARHADKITFKHDNLVIKEIDVLATTDLVEGIKGVDVVISAYNSGWTNPNIYSDFIAGSQAIQQAVKEAGVKRLIVIGGAGSLEIDGHQLVDSPDFPADYKQGALAARDYYQQLKEEKELQWCFFSPAIEMHQGITTGRTGNYRLGSNSPVFNDEGRSILSVQDLAVAIVDEMENNKHPQQRFTAAY